jgi:hypothetical protein
MPGFFKKCPPVESLPPLLTHGAAVDEDKDLNADSLPYIM